MPEVKITGNRQHFDDVMKSVDNDIKRVGADVEFVSMRTRSLYSTALQTSRLILNQFKEIAWAQTALAAEQIISSQVSAGRIAIESAAAFASGNAIAGVSLGTLAISMQATLANSIQAKALAEQNQSRIESIKLFESQYGSLL